MTNGIVDGAKPFKMKGIPFLPPNGGGGEVID